MFYESKGGRPYLFLNQPKTCTAQKFNKLGVKFIVRVPGTSSEFHGRIEVGKHVNFPGWVLGWNGWLGQPMVMRVTETLQVP